MYLTENLIVHCMFRNLILFHRRLITLGILFVLAMVILFIQGYRLMVFEHKSKLDKAEQRLYKDVYLPTWRGMITDRKGRVIAQDIPSYAIGIRWDYITEDIVLEQSMKDGKDSVGDTKWQSMSPKQRQKQSEAFVSANASDLDSFWNQVSEIGNIDRGMLDNRLEYIRSKVSRMAEVVWAKQEAAHLKRYGGDFPFVPRPIQEQRSSHVIFPDVSDSLVLKFKDLQVKYPSAITIQYDRTRDYPNKEQVVLIDQSSFPEPMREYKAAEISLNRVGEILVGDVRSEVWAEDVEQLPFINNGEVNLAGYRAGDEVGNRGLELQLESKLRGVRGQIVSNYQGEELSRINPIGGQDITTTLDLLLQARIEAILSQELGLMQSREWHRNTLLPINTPLRGAIVVLNVENSEVLAMASSPLLDSENDSNGIPELNRAVDGLYPPGSIIKPLVYLAAMSEHEFGYDESIECTGHYFKANQNAARCWIYRPQFNKATHGYLKTVEALARSCNIFFYELGMRLGFAKLMQWYEFFGLGKPLPLHLTNRNAIGTYGHMPSAEDIDVLEKRGALPFETISIAIGQGSITWSPLHAAAAYATLARNGIWESPTLIKDVQTHAVDLQIDPDYVQLALDGLSDSIEKSYGTGSRLRYGPNSQEPIFTAKKVRLWGKTGTAEAPPYELDPALPLINGLDHSWFLVMASHEKSVSPEIVIAVLVEHGGSGGRVAGPIANQVLFALQSEGYLTK